MITSLLQKDTPSGALNATDQVTVTLFAPYHTTETEQPEADSNDLSCLEAAIS